MTNKIILPPIDKSPEAEPFPIQESLESTCKKEKEELVFRDILYISGSKNFYLLSDDACEELDYAESKVEKFYHIETSEEAIKYLTKRGVFDGVLQADLLSFIPKERMKRYLSNQKWIDEQSTHIKKYYKENPHDEDHEGFYFERKKRTVEIELEQEKAIAKAEKTGLKYTNGKLYSPREIEIEKLLNKYVNSKKIFISKKHLTPNEQIKAVSNELQSLMQFDKSNTYGYHVKDALKHYKVQQENDKKLKSTAYPKLLASIAKLLRVGILVPESALSISNPIQKELINKLKKDDEVKNLLDNLSKGEDDFHVGFELLAILHHYQIQENKYTEELRKILRTLLNATNEYSIPPTNILNKQVKVIEKYRKKQDILIDYAHKIVDYETKPYLLIWNRQDYNKKPLQRLMYDNYPLREYIRLENLQAKNNNITDNLKYLSLIDLPNNENSKSNYSSRRSPDEYLYKALRSKVKKITISNRWFDENGMFIREKLLTYLSDRHITVNSLNRNSEWFNIVEKILYKKTLSDRLNPFNNSYQAQLIRFIYKNKTLSSSNSSLELKLLESKESVYTTALNYSHNRKKEIFKNSDGEDSKDSSKKKKGKSSFGKVEVSKRYDLINGRMSLVEAMTGEKFIAIPNESDLNSDMKIPFTCIKYDYEKEQYIVDKFEYCIGCFQVIFTSDFYGFAGATTAIGTNLELSDKGLRRTKLTLDISEDKQYLKSDGLKLKLEAQVGVEFTSRLIWHTPSRFEENREEWIPDFILPSDVKALNLVTGRARIIAGVEKDFPIKFYFKNKKFEFDIKVPISGLFKVDVYGQLNFECLSVWLWIFQRILRKANYHRVSIADGECFEKLSLLSRFMVYSHVNIGIILAGLKDGWDTIKQTFNFDRAGIVAYTIVFGNDEEIKPWIQNFVPEALAPMLKVLIEDETNITIAFLGKETSYTKNEIYLLQLIAIDKILSWLSESFYSQEESKAAKRQLEEAITRIYQLKKPITTACKEIAFVNNYDSIRSFTLKKRKIRIINNELREYDLIKIQRSIISNLEKISYDVYLEYSSRYLQNTQKHKREHLKHTSETFTKINNNTHILQG